MTLKYKLKLMFLEKNYLGLDIFATHIPTNIETLDAKGAVASYIY